MKDEIVITGAREHNLKNIDLTLPRNSFIVITGLSGSGKSSLAFDTIYAEGQRRYVESLSAYARQFLGQMEKPLVESIEGLSPAISIDQKSSSRNPRSTVGTITEVYDYLRLLYARVGTPHCPVCHKVIEPVSIDDVVEQVGKLEDGTRLYILAPVVRGKEGTHPKVFDALRKDGFTRVKVDGEVKNLLEGPIELDKNKKHDIEVLVDRLVMREGLRSRIADSLETALRLEDKIVKVEVLGEGEILFNMSYSCPEHGEGIAEMEPRSFSFNAPYGACDECKGLGFLQKVDPDLVFPDKSLSLNQGAIKFLKDFKKSSYYAPLIKRIFEGTNVTFDTPLKDYPEKTYQELLYGNAPTRYVKGRFGMRAINKGFEGFINHLERRYRETSSPGMRMEIEMYMSENPCPKCHGKRLKDEVLAVTVNDLNIHELTSMSISNIHEFFEHLDLPGAKATIAEQITKEIRARVKFLMDVGLDYLTLARSASSLSGGESQRIRLATQIGSGLVGVLYILDEPSIGLHQRDNARLLQTLRNLTDLGNTLLVVEHDEETIRSVDHIVDVGPGAGEKGGSIVAQGSLDEIMKVKESVTAQYLSGEKYIPVPLVRRTPKGEMTVVGAAANNLKNIDVKIPLGVITCVTGVSGSGKSSLINEVLYKELRRRLYKSHSDKPGAHKDIVGWEQINKIIAIDQSPIGRTPRSNPATYTKVFDPIRDLFAALPESNKRGYKKGRFSFNVKGGRCEACKGDGINKIEMHFLSDVYVTCETCHGKRYNRETLEVRYNGKNIYEVLEMTVSEALEFFSVHEPIRRRLETLYDVGLGYIKLGQPSTQLSGGEAQRIKLASELSKRSTGDTLYILDEPTTGLHMADVHMLIGVLDRLAEGGNTLLIIEHNLDVVKSADYIIDLGPEGGDKGGEILAEGTPEEVAKVEKSYTGRYLKEMLTPKM
ncbi:MAG TPA: excinuclease ABC subunit UvrA [Tissierellia bacterium]|nr:excinuclease ABC subunit UvrA [Tissierellia bacterium]